MKCSFCSAEIHFWEDFYTRDGLHFHTQLVTLNATIRCKRVHNKELEKVERKLAREKK